MSSSIRAIGRRQIAVVVAALLAFGGFAVYRTQSSAGAHEVTTVLGLQCTVAGALSATYVTTHDPTDGAHAGAPFTLNVNTQLGAVPDTFKGIGLSTMNITIPIPDQIVAGGDIMVMGGNLTKTSQTVSGTSAVLGLTAASGVTLGTLQMPTLMFMLNVKPGATGPIVFQGPSTIQLNVNFLGTPITENCTAAAGNPPLVSVPVVGTGGPTTTMDDHGEHDHGNPTTTAPPTTARPTTTAPPTTARPTTTAPPTTARPTTTAPPTTARPTTTAPPTTARPTTTHPPTTMRPPGSNPLLELLKRLICLLFRIGC